MIDKKNVLSVIGLVLFSTALAIAINSCFKMSETGDESQKTSVTIRP